MAINQFRNPRLTGRFLAPEQSQVAHGELRSLETINVYRDHFATID